MLGDLAWVIGITSDYCAIMRRHCLIVRALNMRLAHCVIVGTEQRMPC